MKVREIRLKDFKGFTDFTVTDIPSSARVGDEGDVDAERALGSPGVTISGEQSLGRGAAA